MMPPVNEAHMAPFMKENVRLRNPGATHQISQFLWSISGTNGILKQPLHDARIMASVPADVPGICQARRAAKISEKNGAVRFYNSQHLTQDSCRVRKVMQDGIAENEIKCAAGEGKPVCAGLLEENAGVQSHLDGRSRGSLHHVPRAV